MTDRDSRISRALDYKSAPPPHVRSGSFSGLGCLGGIFFPFTPFCLVAIVTAITGTSPGASFNLWTLLFSAAASFGIGVLLRVKTDDSGWLTASAIYLFITLVILLIAGQGCSVGPFAK